MEKLNATARREIEILVNDRNILGVQKLDETEKKKLIRNKN